MYIMLFDKMPSWVHSWCYVFAALAVLTIVALIASILMSKDRSMMAIGAALLAATLQVGTFTTFFWMCRNSTGPTM